MKTRQSKRSAVETAADQSLRNIRNHPFVQRASAGQLSKEQAERWIFCAGRESRSFPTILENMIEKTFNPRIKAILQANVDDEYGNGDPEHAHFNHYLHLLDKLGIPRERFYHYKERAGINLALSLAYNISMQENEATAIGYMLVNEGMTPITYGSVQVALTHHHPGLKTEFFRLHTEVDARHVEELYKAVDELGDDQLAALLFGIQIGERGMAVLLDEALGMFDWCSEMPVYKAA